MPRSTRTTLLRTGLIVLGVVVLCAALRGGWLLLQYLAYEAHPVHHGGDGRIYTVVARGWLHGLKPYVDLFESKPPGMFVISLISLALTGDMRIANLLQAAVEIGLSVAMFLALMPVFRRRELSRIARGALVGATLLFSMLLMLYTIARCGGFQTESFGAFFTLLFLLAAHKLHQRKSWVAIAVPGLFLASALGLKEPFVLTALAGVLLLMEHPRDVVRMFLLPLLFALVLGTVTLQLLGLLGPYLTIYMPEMLIGRLELFVEPTWVLAFFVLKPLKDLWLFSPALSVVILLLWLLSFAIRTHMWHTRRHAVAVGAVLLAFCVTLALERAMLTHFLLLGWSFRVTFWFAFPLLLAGLALGLSAAFRLLPRAEARLITVETLRHLFALVLTTCAVGMVGFMARHQGFAIPVYVILFLSAMREIGSALPARWAKGALIVMLIVFSIGNLWLPMRAAEDMIRERVAIEDRAGDAAAIIDGILDRCGAERYLILGEPEVFFHRTQHLPYGPGFSSRGLSMPISWRPPPGPHLLNTWKANLFAAPFLVARVTSTENGIKTVDAYELPADVIQHVQENFTLNAPACVGNVTVPDGLLFLYRAGWGNEKA